MWVVRKMNKTKQRQNDIMRKAYDKDRGNIGASTIKRKHVAYQSRPLPKGLSQRVTFLVVGSLTLHQIIVGNRGPRACQSGLRSFLTSWDPSSWIMTNCYVPIIMWSQRAEKTDEWICCFEWGSF